MSLIAWWLKLAGFGALWAALERGEEYAEADGPVVKNGLGVFQVYVGFRKRGG